MKLISTFVCVVLLPLLVACSTAGASSATPGSTPASAAPQQFTVKALDTMKFDPPTLTAKAGQPIQVTLDNGGQIAHDFAMADGVAQPVSITAQPGQTATITFTIVKPGTYTYVCNQPGHEQAGMKGTLTVIQCPLLSSRRPAETGFTRLPVVDRTTGRALAGMRACWR